MAQDTRIQGLPDWRRPPMKCPQCMEDLSADRLPVAGLERYATRCQGCQAIIRFVREAIAPQSAQGLPSPVTWVPALLGDRRSRVTPRTLWEPCDSAWQSLGGSGARTFGFVDPPRTLCDYPPVGGGMRIEKRWEIDVSRNHPIVSVTAANGELWAVTSMGAVHVYGNAQVNAGPEQAPKALPGSPAQLQIQMLHPPATRGQWWMFQSKDTAVRFMYRNPRIPSQLDWPICPYDLPPRWNWVGAPFAIDGLQSGPTFAGAAESEEGDVYLFVFTLPEEPDVGFTPTAERISLNEAINVPVQVPLMYARPSETDAGAFRGHLVWVDRQGNLHAIDTKLPIREWATAQRIIASAAGLVEQVASPAAPTRSGIPPLPGALPPLPRALPPLPGSLPLLPSALPPLPGVLPPKPNSQSITLSAAFDDSLCVTVEPFASQYGAAGRGGVRLWSIQRHQFDDNIVSVRSFCLDGGPKAEREWQTLPEGTALSGARKFGGGTSMVSISMLPVYVDPPGTDAGQRTAHISQVLAISSHKDVDVYTRQDQRKLGEPRAARIDGDSLSCTPMLTPYGLVVPWNNKLEIWTFDIQGGVESDVLPGGLSGQQAARDGKPASLLPIRTKGRGERVYPAIIANRMWIPSDDGKVHCVDILPESSFTDKTTSLETK